jgi:hypothetical protein
MPQRKFLAATEISVFDFELFLGGRRQLVSGYEDINICQTRTKAEYTPKPALKLSIRLPCRPKKVLAILHKLGQLASILSRWALRVQSLLPKGFCS